MTDIYQVMLLTLIWVGFLGVCFEVGGGKIYFLVPSAT